MIVENIQQLCKEKGTSFFALERQLGIGNGVIARWSTCSPRVDSLKRVADYFGVTVDELLEPNEKDPSQEKADTHAEKRDAS